MKTIDVSGYSGEWVAKALAAMKADGAVALRLEMEPMKQPMSKTEIAVWEAVATGIIIAGSHPQDAYDTADDAITARRAALIADAHVGWWIDECWQCWQCWCDGECHCFRDEYCERCHTRRPDVVYRLGDDGHVEAAT